MDPSPGKPRDCHEIWNGRGQGAGGDLILRELGEKMSREQMQRPGGARMGKGEAGNGNFVPGVIPGG